MSTRNKFEHGSEGKKNTWNTSLSSMADTNTSTPTSSKSTRRQRSTPTKASTTSLTTPPKPLSSYSVISFERLNESIELMTVLSEGFLKDIGQDTPDDSCSEAEKAPGVVSRIFRSGLQNGSREKVNRRTRNGTQTTDESTIRTVDKSWRPPRPPPPTAEALQRGKDDTSTSKATQNAKAISYTKHPPSRRVLSLPSGLSWSGYTNQLTSVTSNPSADLIKKSEELTIDAARVLIFATPRMFRTQSSLRKDLLKATANGYTERVQELLMRDDVMTFRDACNDNNGLRAVHYAVLEEHHKILHLLLEAGVSTNAVSNAGESPMDIAKRTRNLTAMYMIQQHEDALQMQAENESSSSEKEKMTSQTITGTVQRRKSSTSTTDSFNEQSNTRVIQGPIQVEVHEEDCGPWYDRHILYRITVTNEHADLLQNYNDVGNYVVLKRFKDFHKLYEQLVQAPTTGLVIPREVMEALIAARPTKILLARFRVSTGLERARMFEQMLRVAARDASLNKYVIAFMGLK
eukprot:CFRG0517T1